MLRGKAYNTGRETQVRDYSGLRYGNITPTDIDAVIEYHNKCWIIIEVKFGETELPFGQRLALERMIDDLQKTKPSLLIIASHDFEIHKEIDFSVCIVREYRYMFQWYKANYTDVKKLTDRFLKGLE